MAKDLFGNFIGIANQQRAFWPGLRVKACSCYRRPAPFPANLIKYLRIAGEEFVCGLAACFCYEPNGMEPDFQVFFFMTGFDAGFFIKIDQWFETMRFAADDGHHQWQAEPAGPYKGLGRTADANPNRKTGLYRPGINGLVCQGRPEPAGPGNLLMIPDLQEQIQFFFEEGVIIVQLKTKERIGFDKGSASGHDLGTAIGNNVRVEKFWNTLTGSAALSTVTALVSRMRLVFAAAAARIMEGAASRNSLR